jgi:hypothetical protein
MIRIIFGRGEAENAGFPEMARPKAPIVERAIAEKVVFIGLKN